MNIKKLIPENIKILLKMGDALFFRYINSKINSDFECNSKTKRCFFNKKSPYYKYEYFGDNTPICCATNLYNLLKDVTKVLENNNLEYFISFGTLLGAIRHKGLIPWDTDIDLIIPEQEKEKIFEIMKNAFEKKSYIVKKENEEGIIGSLIRIYLSKINSLHIDLFTYLDKKDSIVFGYNRVFSKEDIYPLIKLPFYDLKLFAPNRYKAHLEKLYGSDYMKYGYKQWALKKNKFEIKNFLPATIKQ